ncbi:MAG: 4Fe-4S dicluster domain-containing protein [Fimbriimonadaceae bacterium]|nr:4Fe-4S dicluster domain-containing protein [Fimbriimonadaceae bacterium]
MQTLSDLARAAGVVGAGGAGFPTHVKVSAQADTVIANGAECEPLLYKDTELMTRAAPQMIAGLRASMAAVGATRGVIGIKQKRHAAVAALQAALTGSDLELLLLGDYYPSGDEYELVHAATGRLIPPAGIPLQVGCVVHNVESLWWLADAAAGVPAVDKWFSINGAVARPQTFLTPVGVRFAELLEFCGGATVPDPVALIGGAMMGRFTDDWQQPVTRTTGGLIVLDRSHPLIQRKTKPVAQMHRIGKSACDQCSYCTELCPRYLLGYDVQPHKVMRTLGFTASGGVNWSQWGLLCCACGICTLYSCPESLFPKEACDQAKTDLRAQGITWQGTGRELRPHPLHEDRRLPVKKLVARLGLAEYNVPAPWTAERPAARVLEFALNAHVGAPAEPRVQPGERVRRGQVLAEIPDGKLGARVHCSVDGIVQAVGARIVVETA